MLSRGSALPALAVCAIGAMLSATAGCSAARYPVAFESDDVELSAVLIDELGRVVRSALAQAEAAGPDALPAEARAQRTFAEHVRLSIVEQHADALLVTPKQEQLFEAGHFADDHNRRQVDLLLSQIADRGVEMTTVERYLADQRRADELDGARLELAHRLLRDRFDGSLMGELLTAY